MYLYATHTHTAFAALAFSVRQFFALCPFAYSLPLPPSLPHALCVCLCVVVRKSLINKLYTLLLGHTQCPPPPPARTMLQHSKRCLAACLPATWKLVSSSCEQRDKVRSEREREGELPGGRGVCVHCNSSRTLIHSAQSVTRRSYLQILNRRYSDCCAS